MRISDKLQLGFITAGNFSGGRVDRRFFVVCNPRICSGIKGVCLFADGYDRIYASGIRVVLWRSCVADSADKAVTIELRVKGEVPAAPPARAQPLGGSAGARSVPAYLIN